MFGKRKRKYKIGFVFGWLGTFLLICVLLCLLFFYGDENIQDPPFSCEDAEVSPEELLTDKITEDASEADLSDEDFPDSRSNSSYSLENTADGYEVSLYDKKGEEVWSGVYPKEPWIREITEDILEIGISTGSPSSYVSYFNKVDAKMSGTYFNAKLLGDKYIAYMENNEVLVLQDIFREGVLYQEIERDFSKTADPISAIIDIWMLDNENAVLKYCKGIDYEIKTEIISIAQDGSNLETWVGEYDFFEGYFDPTFNHPPLNMSYHIQIYENEGSYYADLEISGHMTYTKIRAGVYGDEECINLVFLEYLPENMGNEIYDDCELLSFRKDGEDIYTYWGKVEAIFYENQNQGEIYFTKVGEK